MLRRHQQLRTQIYQLKDAALFAVALWLAHALRVWLGTILKTHWSGNILEREIQPFIDFSWLYLIIIPGAPLILESQGFYQRRLSSARDSTLWMLFKGCLLVTMGVIVVMFLFKMDLARSVVILFGIISFMLVFVSEALLRWAYQSKYGQLQFKKRIIIVGAQEDARRMRAELEEIGDRDLEILAELDLNETTIEQLVAKLHERSANGVIINARHTYFGQVEKAIQACEREGVEAWLVADFFQTQISRTSFDDFYGRPVLVFRSVPEVSWQGVAKQIIDVTGAVVLITAFSPLFIAAAIMIRCSSSGTILFRQRRCGLNG